MASVCTSSLDRGDEFQRCCAETMGFEWVDRFDDDEDENDAASNGADEDTLQVTNLLDDDDDDDDFEDCYCRKENSMEIKIKGKIEPETMPTTDDAWTDSALRIRGDLDRMSRWIQSKKREYVGLDMKDEEAGLIQSTVMSFAATTASELETLRNMITTSRAAHSNSKSNSRIVVSHNQANHRAGIVQILLAQLQEQVTKPFAALQQQRVREAVQLWQNPLHCKLYQDPRPRRCGGGDSDSDSDDKALFGGGGDDDDDNDGDMGENLPTEQRFLPQRSYRESRRHPKPSESEDSFISKYAHKPRTGRPTNRPRFLVGLAQQRARAASTENDHDPSAIPPSHTPKHPKPTSEHNPLTEVPMSSFGGNVVDAEQVFEDFTTRSSQAGHHHANANAAANDYQHQLEEDLRTESIQLATTLMASNELDSVQQMEKRMVEITTLIGQFSNLVQEQQEQVLQVHDSAKETKDNLDKGQENLIDAAERTKQSKHYKAWAILAMTGILAFFHILRG